MRPGSTRYWLRSGRRGRWRGGGGGTGRGGDEGTWRGGESASGISGFSSYIIMKIGVGLIVWHKYTKFKIGFIAFPETKSYLHCRDVACNVSTTLRTFEGLAGRFPLLRE